MRFHVVAILAGSNYEYDENIDSVMYELVIQSYDIHRDQ